MPSGLNFPSNPTNGQQHTIGSRTFSWNGTVWSIYSTPEAPVITQEEIQDFIAPLFSHSSHSNVTATYDDDNNKILLTVSPPAATLTQEQVQDYVAPLFEHSIHSNLSATYDDDNNKIVLSAEAPSSVTVSGTAPTSPVEGNIWYNSTIGKLFIYYGTIWAEV